LYVEEIINRKPNEAMPKQAMLQNGRWQDCVSVAVGARQKLQGQMPILSFAFSASACMEHQTHGEDSFSLPSET
jgi:hypothetical protein